MEKIDYICNMTRLEKCELLKQKGYTYNPETGQIFGVRGKEITRKNKKGYISIRDNKFSSLYGHHFAWYMTYGNVDFIELDHDDNNTSNNRIDNLRILTHMKNCHNRRLPEKGYYWDEINQKWRGKIVVNKKQIYLGLFKTEVEAREAYINAKKKYHNI